MNLDSLIAFADDKELFVLVYASAACDVVLLGAVMTYYTLRKSSSSSPSKTMMAVTAGLLLLILLLVLVLATLATQGGFAARVRALSAAERTRLDDLHSRPHEQTEAASAIRKVLSDVPAAYRAGDPGSTRTLDGHVDDLNRVLEGFPTFRDPLRELRLSAVILGVCLVLAGLAVVAVPASTPGGTVIALIFAAVTAAITTVVALSSVGALGGGDAIRVRRVDAEDDWSKGEVQAALLASYNSLGPAMNAFGVRTRVRLLASQPAPEHRPFWVAAVALLSVGCLVFVAGVVAAVKEAEVAYVPLLAVAVCVAVPSVAVFLSFFARP